MAENTIKNAILRYREDQTRINELLSALEMENLYVPFKKADQFLLPVREPARVTMSDGSKCYAVFSSDSEVDEDFYNNHDWQMLKYHGLEKYLLQLPELLDVIIDPYSDYAFVLKAEGIRQIAEERARPREITLSEDGTLDTEYPEYEAVLGKILPAFRFDNEIGRVFCLKYVAPDEKETALCLIIDVVHTVETEAIFARLHRTISTVVGNAATVFTLPYKEFRIVLKKLKAEPVYTKQTSQSDSQP